MATDQLTRNSQRKSRAARAGGKSSRLGVAHDAPGAPTQTAGAAGAGHEHDHEQRRGHGGSGGGGSSGGGGGMGGGTGASGAGGSATGRGSEAYRVSEWTAPLRKDEAKRPLLSYGNKLPGTTVERLLRKAARITDPLELRALVLPEILASPKRQELTRAVRSVISAADGGGHLRMRKGIAEAVLYEVLIPRYNPKDEDDEIPSADEVQSFADPAFATIGPAIYQDAVFDTISSLYQKDRPPARRLIEDIADALQRRRVHLADPDFRERIFVTLDDIKRESQFEKFFDRDIDGSGPVVGDFKGQSIPRAARRRAIRVLENLGVDPDSTNDSDWGRVALGVGGARLETPDVMALAGYGFDSALEHLESEPPLPDFETEVSTGFNAQVIRECADLYYITQFSIVFDVTDAIALRFFEGMNLGLTDTAAKLYTYVKRKTQRFAHEDRMKVAEAVFDEDTFKPLMGRLVENLIEYNRSRHGSDLLHGVHDDGTRPVLFVRSAVIRSIENLQRYLSDRGGGIAVFVAREGSAQWLEAQKILESEDLLRYFGGRFKSGMLGVLEEVGREIYNKPPAVDRIRTLAVHGRRIIRWLADNTNNVAFLTDADLDVLSEHVQNWLAAYRRPDTEPTWLDDDRYYDADEREDEGDIADEAVKEAVDNAGGDSAEADILT